MARALLINPSYRDSYGSAKASMINPIYPTLSLLTTAAMAESRGHTIKILDMSYMQYDSRVVEEAVRSFRPDVVGVTATTPLMNQLRDMSVLIKDVSEDIVLVGGGSHVSALPAESLQESRLDIVAVGEGDYTFADIMDGDDWAEIPGIHYRKDGGIYATPPRPFVKDLDDLPMPAWHLYRSAEYRNKISRMLCRRPPLTMVEFSRGCVFKCDFCASKNTMALGYRKKSPRRCAEEMKAVKAFGYNEVALADDIFTSDADWAKEVAEEIIRSGVKIAWTCSNGIRVESADAELFKTLARAGCYRVSFGFESGNDAVLKAFGKSGKASLEKGYKAVKLARAAGIEVNGFFMLGLSPDTEESMRETIEFARSLPLDILKFGITIAFPGTPMFREYRQKGLIRSYNWDDYFIYTEKVLFAHPNLDFEQVKEFAVLGYRHAVLTNPSFIARRLWRGIRTGEFFWDLYYFLRFVGSPPINHATHSAVYYAKDRWPTYDFANQPITFYPPRPATNKLTNEHIQGVVV